MPVTNGSLDAPDLQQLFTQMDPLPMQGGSQQPPQNTTRTYERVSRSQRTEEGTENQGIAAMLGFDPGGDPAGTGQFNGQM